jgi:hypothetical protein
MLSPSSTSPIFAPYKNNSDIFYGTELLQSLHFGMIQVNKTIEQQHAPFDAVLTT